MAALKKAATIGGSRFVLQTAPFSFYGKTDTQGKIQVKLEKPGSGCLSAPTKPRMLLLRNVMRTCTPPASLLPGIEL